MDSKNFFDTDKFISIVHSHRIVWDKAAEGYFMKNERENAWRSILEAMYEDAETWDDDQIKATG